MTTSDSVDPGGCKQQLTWKGSAKTLSGLPLPMLILGGVQPTVTLEKMCVDFVNFSSSPSINSPPPRSTMFNHNPSKGFGDPFQLQGPPGSTLSEVILPKSLRILSKLSVN